MAEKRKPDFRAMEAELKRMLKMNHQVTAAVDKTKPESTAADKTKPDSTAVDKTKPESTAADKTKPESTGADKTKAQSQAVGPTDVVITKDDFVSGKVLLPNTNACNITSKWLLTCLYYRLSVVKLILVYA